MLRYLAVAILFSSASSLAAGQSVETAKLPASVMQKAFDPVGGERVRFQVLREGKPFGYHHIDFDRLEDGRLQVTNDVRFRFALGPITLFNYQHRSTETWANGALRSLEGETRKSGKDFTVSAMAQNGEILVDGTLNMGAVAADLIPFSHWHAGQVDVREILSSESGELIPIDVTPVGRETLVIDGVSVEANRYFMDSELDADLWYDDAGRWLQFRFRARGQEIEYVLSELY